MKRGSFIIVFLCAITSAWAQDAAPSGFDANANLANMSSSMFRSFDNRFEGMKGHPTVFPDFVYGNVNMKSGERAEGQELNYDAITNQLIVRSRLYKKVLSVRYDLVESFELITAERDTLHFVKATENGFVQSIYEGKTKVYLKYVKNIIKANYGGAYNANARTYDELVDANIYLASIDGAPLDEIKLTRKGLESKFPAKKEAIKSYLKEKKPDFKDNDEIAQFFRYLDAQ
jgi:hypothetical protein